MKFALVFSAVLAVCAAQPPVSFGNLNRLHTTRRPPTFKPYTSNHVTSSDQAGNVFRYDNEVNPDGSYRYKLEIDNSIAAEAYGTPRNFGGNPPVAPIVSQGTFSWTSPEGQLIDINYTADENGYKPFVFVIATPPLPYTLSYGSGSYGASEIASSITNHLQRSQNRKA